MLLLSYTTDTESDLTWGVQTDERTVLALPQLAARSGRELPGTLLEFIRGGGNSAELRTLLDDAAADDLAAVSRPIDSVHVRAPLRPGKIVGVGLNYVEHVEESARTLDTANQLPERPVLFSKPGTAVVGPGDPIEHNANLTEQLDWEVELAVVIGRTARRVAVSDALEHVFGYSITNDISARDQRRSGQWFYSKGQDSYAPLGPVVLTADELPDPQTLSLSLTVNGVQKQSGNTKHMLFPVAELIADISAGMTLEPGDVIATGSPQGVGAAQIPPQFLQPGDVVAATIEGIGTLRNPVVDAR